MSETLVKLPQVVQGPYAVVRARFELTSLSIDVELTRVSMSNFSECAHSCLFAGANRTCVQALRHAGGVVDFSRGCVLKSHNLRCTDVSTLNPLDTIYPRDGLLARKIPLGKDGGGACKHQASALRSMSQPLILNFTYSLLSGDPSRCLGC